MRLMQRDAFLFLHHCRPTQMSIPLWVDMEKMHSTLCNELKPLLVYDYKFKNQT